MEVPAMSDASHSILRAGIMEPHRRGGPSFPLAMLALLVGFAAPASAGHDPNRTLTIYVHGFDRAGADRHGVYGTDVHEDLADSLAAMAGLAVAGAPGGPLPPNAVTATTYYGDSPPAYYSTADRAELDRLTAEWGGGVPRYAYIVARYAQNALARSGADQLNFVSASLGSLIVRWMIEKNVAGLAGSGHIARWLTIEGLIAGNWAASRDELIHYVEFVQPEPIDVDHMAYDWVDAHLHSPRTEGDDPLYAGILVGQEASTDDSGNNGALSAAMLAYGEYQPNDGVQVVSDARFQTFTARSRFLGLPPTLAFLHVDHLGIDPFAGAYAQAAAFITGRRRVTVTMTSARVQNLHEPHEWYWDWTPAEVVFESSVYSPAVLARWGIGDALSERVERDATAPLRRFDESGDSRSVGEPIFDDFVLPGETNLRIDLHAAEIDYSPRYGVFETASTPYTDDLGGGTVSVSTLAPGGYSFAAPDWSCEISVSIVDYPFAALAGVPAPRPRAFARMLVIMPNPAVSAVLVRFSGAPSAPEEPARLEIRDVGGRVVRVIEGSVAGGFHWDGRDAHGRPAPPGVYLHRAITREGTWIGRSCRLR
jgi:hypothetical protein